MKYHFVSGLTILFCLQGVIAQDKMEIIHSRHIKSDLGGGDAWLALGPDGSSVFVANDKDSRIFEYDSMTGKLRGVFDTKLKDVQCVQISPDGMKLAAGENGLVLFDLKNRKMLFHHNESSRVNSVAFSANNKFLVLGTVDEVVKILSLPEGKEWRSFARSRRPGMCVSLSPDTSRCAAGWICQLLPTCAL